MTIEQLRKAPCLLAIVSKKQLETYKWGLKLASKIEPNSHRPNQHWFRLEVALISAAFAESLELVEAAESMFLKMIPSKAYEIEGRPGMFYVAIKQPVGSPCNELLDANNRPDTRCTIFATTSKEFAREDSSIGHATDEAQFTAEFVENHELAANLDIDKDHEALLLLNETGENGERQAFLHESLTGGRE
ncbi:hypothetical protein N0V82_006516 [Gnomoniopsis sp. IMI 355080]|nr:hypothetical protein N0V82_006516 [Gnomoniopsis sp. IMI 355080]